MARYLRILDDLSKDARAFILGYFFRPVFFLLFLLFIGEHLYPGEDEILPAVDVADYRSGGVCGVNLQVVVSAIDVDGGGHKEVAVFIECS